MIILHHELQQFWTCTSWEKTLLLIGCAKNLPYGITIETFKQQKQHKIKICYFYQLLHTMTVPDSKGKVSYGTPPEFSLRHWTNYHPPPHTHPVFFATESNRIEGRRVMWQTMMLVLEVPGWEAGVKHGGRVNTGVSPSYVSQPQYADLPYTPAASTTGPPALFRRCQIFFLNADCSQTVSRASKVGPYVTEIVKCRPNPARGRKYQTNKEALI